MPIYRLACPNGHEGDYLAGVNESVACEACGCPTWRVPQPFRSDVSRVLEDQTSAEFKHAQLNQKFLNDMPAEKRAEFTVKEIHMPKALQSKYEAK